MSCDKGSHGTVSSSQAPAGHRQPPLALLCPGVMPLPVSSCGARDVAPLESSVMPLSWPMLCLSLSLLPVQNRVSCAGESPACVPVEATVSVVLRPSCEYGSALCVVRSTWQFPVCVNKQFCRWTMASCGPSSPGATEHLVPHVLQAGLLRRGSRWGQEAGWWGPTHSRHGHTTGIG